MLKLNWVKCGDDRHWCSLRTLDLETVKGSGVYIIWHEGNPARVVRIGQGDIADSLSHHRADLEILRYAATGTLRVTWAVVAADQRAGVERYLASLWPPPVGDAFPEVEPIAVNAPW